MQIPFRGKPQIQLGERRPAAIGRLQLLGLLGQLVRDQLQVLPIERLIDHRRDGAGRLARQHVFDGIQYIDGFARFGQNVRHVAGIGQRPRLPLVVVRRVEDDLDRRERRIGAQLPHQLVAVHRGHHDVGDHELRIHGARQNQALAAVAGFEHLMPLILHQGHHQLAVGGIVVDDDDGDRVRGARGRVIQVGVHARARTGCRSR